MGEVCEKAGIEIRLSTKVTPEVIKDVNPDEVIVAVGSSPMELNIPGSKLANVTNSHDVLAGKVKVDRCV